MDSSIYRRYRPPLIVLWVSVSLLGFGNLIRHAVEPGPSAVVSAETSPFVSSTLSSAHHQWTALVFLHPNCPCSRATLAEATRLINKLGASVRWVAVISWPADETLRWENAPICRLVQDTPGIEVFFDQNGYLTAQHQALTSGEVHLHDQQGHLRFRGGITPARGHQGVNAGSLAVVDWVREGRSLNATLPTFGCRLTTGEITSL